jgi:hypothetical protein
VVALSNLLGTAAFTSSTNYDAFGSSAALSNALGTAAFSNASAFEASGSVAALSNLLGTAAFTASTNYETAGSVAAFSNNLGTMAFESATNYVTASNAAATYLPLAGGTMSNTIDMNGNDIVTIAALEANTINSYTYAAYGIGSTADVNAVFNFEYKPILPWYLTTNDAASTYFPSDGGTINGNVLINGFNLDMDNGEITNVSALQFGSGADFFSNINGDIVTGSKLVLINFQSNAVLTLDPINGIQVGENSFYAYPNGDIEHDSTNTATLGIVTAQTVTASFIGDGSGLTNVTGYATTQRVAAIEAQTSNWNSAYNATTNLGTMAYTATGDNLGTMAYTSTGDYYTITATTNLLTGYATTNAAALIESDLDALEASTNNWNAAYNATTNIGTMAYTDTNNYYTTIEADALFIATNDTTVVLDGVTLSNGFLLASGAVLNGFNTDTRTATNTWNFGGLEVDGDEVYHEGNFNASLYVTVASFQANLTNYAKRVAVPASNTAYGVAGNYAVGTTNVYFYVPGTNRWGRVPMTLNW